MSVDIKIPEVGESVTEAIIEKWLKSEGDRVEKDEIIAELETDKVSVELPAPASGVLKEIVAQEGETVDVGGVIGYIEEGEAAASGEEEKAKKEKEEEGVEEKEEKKKRTKKKAREKKTEESAPEKDRAEKEEKGKREDEEGKGQKEDRERREDEGRKREEESRDEKGEEGEERPVEVEARIMPAARHALARHDVDADEVEGTGPGGRILKEDVLRFVERQKQPTRRRGEREERTAAREREEEVVEMSPIRRRIARRLVESQQTGAHLTTFNEIDMSAVLDLRRRYREQFEKKYEVGLGFMSFFVKASVDALKRFPEINAEVRDDTIVYRNYYDIGVAVSTDRGLIVPVVRGAERLSLAEIERQIDDYARRARNGKIELKEIQGGTFTISNGGVFGSLLSTPIINPPQSGVLGMHAIQERAVARNGEVVVRPMMYVALTYDHRIVDGREAVSFLRRIKETVEEPARMLIEI